MTGLDRDESLLPLCAERQYCKLKTESVTSTANYANSIAYVTGFAARSYMACDSLMVKKIFKLFGGIHRSISRRCWKGKLPSAIQQRSARREPRCAARIGIPAPLASIPVLLFSGDLRATRCCRRARQMVHYVARPGNGRSPSGHSPQARWNLLRLLPLAVRSSRRFPTTGGSTFSSRAKLAEFNVGIPFQHHQPRTKGRVGAPRRTALQLWVRTYL